MNWSKFLKYLFFAIAIIAAIGSWIYTVNITSKLSKAEKERIQLWSYAYKEIQNIDVNQQICPLIIKIIQSNDYIPVMLVNEHNKIIGFANLNRRKVKDSTWLRKKLNIMKLQHKPITIDLGEGKKIFLYYMDSPALLQLKIYPYIQLLVVIIFLIVIYLAALSSKKAEENSLWVALSKETAHQLGNPISSLLTWLEILKMSNTDEQLLKEVEKDINRLEQITERFSKIGSTPTLEPTNLKSIIQKTVNYLQVRSPKNVIYKLSFPEKDIIINLNPPLFQWVIENLAKNSIDAMNGKGTITIAVKDYENHVIIDFSDQGKGIPKNKHKMIFKPGYTTKKHGWGMGLALVKRIIEIYHKGKIFVHQSSPKGTTIRIILKK